MANVRFVRLTKERYLKKDEYDSNALYFCTDSQEMFLGDKIITDGVRLVPTVDDLPSINCAATGVVYYVEDTGNGYVVNLIRKTWELIISAAAKADKYAIQRIQDYLYYIEYDELDYNEGLEFLLDKFTPNFGACSSIRNGNFYGRNYDWTYDDKASFIIDKKATRGKLANIGVARGIVSNEMANEGGYNKYYEYVPFLMLDGINEKGVVCNINVLPLQDKKSHTSGTNPDKPTVPMLGLVRWLLDEAVSADDAINKIRYDYNIVAPTREGLDYEFHFMIADKDKTYVVEFIDNAPVIIEDFVDNKPIMTNFYLSGFNIIYGVKQGLTPHANGLERYDILSNGYTNANTMDGMIQLMQQVLYTNMYKRSVTPFWYSEYYYDYDDVDLTIDSTPEQCDPIVNQAIDNYIHRTRDNPNTWQTVHSVVYDIMNKKLRIMPQECGATYEFQLHIIGAEVPDVISLTNRVAIAEAKLATIAENAQVNVLEYIKIGGTVLPIAEDKSVTIPMAIGNSPGLVIGSFAENGVSVNDDSTMTVNSLNIDKLTQTINEWLILSGGNAVESWD